MAQHSQNRDGGGTIIFDQDDWLAGLNPQFRTGLTDTPAPQYGNGLSTATRFNPFRYLGYASPGFDPTDATNVSVITGTLVNLAVSAESTTPYAYAMANNNLLHRIDISSSVPSVSAAGSWPRAMTPVVGLAEGNDVVAYNCNIASVSTPCVFYSWNDTGGNWNVGQFNTAAGTFIDNFLAAAAFTSTGNNKPHPFAVGANDLLYIGDVNRLHALNGGLGAAGTSSAGVLTLPRGYIITSFALISQPTPFLVVYAYYSPTGNSVNPNLTGASTAKAFFYDYLSLDPTLVVSLEDGVVTGGFSWKGTVGCFTAGKNLVNDGANRNCRLKIWNGSIFETVATTLGNPPINGGIDIVGDSIQWAAGTGGEAVTVYSYGSPFEGVKAGLNRLSAAYSVGQTRGMLRTIGGLTGYQLMSAGATTSGGLMYMRTGTFSASSASVGTTSVRPNFGEGKKGKVRSVRIDFAKASASTGLNISAYLVADEERTSQILSSVALINSTNITKTYYASFQNADLLSFFELRFLFEWGSGSNVNDAPIVRRVVVMYDEMNIENS